MTFWFAARKRASFFGEWGDDEPRFIQIITAPGWPHNPRRVTVGCCAPATPQKTNARALACRPFSTKKHNDENHPNESAYRINGHGLPAGRPQDLSEAGFRQSRAQWKCKQLFDLSHQSTQPQFIGRGIFECGHHLDPCLGGA
jgi:hypothetical protein